MSRKLAPTLRIGLIMGAILLLIAILAPIFLSDAATELTPDLRQGPSSAHWFGTDEFGRDILSRALVATRLTLVMATSATIVSVVVGVVIGGAVWLLPRRVRDGILRVLDAMVAFPAIVLGLIIAAILGPGSISAVIAIGVAGIPGFARLASNMTASVIHRDHVTTTRLLGVSGWSLFTRHVLPNISGPLLMVTTSSFALTLIDISSLSFVGLGVQSPEFDFGRVLNESLASIYVQPWGSLAPALMLVYSGVTVMLIGDGIAATLDPAPRRQKIKPVDTPAAAVPATPEAVLEVVDLRVRTSTDVALVKGISFAIHPGEIVALVGESGSGKSMTAMAVAGLLPTDLHVDAATLRLGDMDLRRQVAARRLATGIGLVYQDPGTTYNPTLRMGTQLAEVARVHLGMSRRAASQAVAQALEGVRIRDPRKRLKQHPHELSGGMLQRATIASSMIMNPALLIADEPTTALDVTVQADVLRQIRRANRADRTAVLFISHDLAVVEALCDRVLVMHSGVIVETLTAAQLSEREVTHPYTQKLLAATPTLTIGAALSATDEGDNRA